MAPKTWLKVWEPAPNSGVLWLESDDEWADFARVVGEAVEDPYWQHVISYTNEHTSYRRGDARLDWEKNRQDKGSTNGNSYMRAEEAVAVTAARRFATP